MEFNENEISIDETDVLEFLVQECQITSQRIGSLIAQGPKIKHKPNAHSASASLAKCNEIFVKERNEGQWRETLLKEKTSLTNQLQRIEEDIIASKNKFNSFSAEISKIQSSIREAETSIIEKDDFIKILEENHRNQKFGKVNRTNFS